MVERKRSNKNVKQVKKSVVKKPIVKKEKTIYELFPARTLTQDDANRIKELFTLSNNVSALIRDYAEKEIAVKKMRDAAKTIEQERQPLIRQIASNLFKTESNYKKLADEIRKQAKQLENALQLVKGQISHRYEDYVSLLIRQNRLLEVIVNNAQLKSITGHRHGDAQTKKEEEVIFEKDFEKQDDADRVVLKELLTKRKERTK